MRTLHTTLALCILLIVVSLVGVTRYGEKRFDSIVSAQTRAPETAGNVLRSGEIRTRHLANKVVTSGKLAIDTVAVSITNGTPAATTAAAANDVGGIVMGCVPSGNQDQFIDNVVVNANGGITVTLAANATATNTFNCRVLRADALGVR